MGFKSELGKVLPGVFRDGLQALEKKDRKDRIVCEDSRQLIVGSVYLDDAVEGGRWDYGIGVRRRQGKEEVLWVEVHSAATKNVSEVLAKLTWLKEWLRAKAPGLRKLTAADGYVWIATDRVDILPNSRQARLLREAGLAMPRKHLRIE